MTWDVQATSGAKIKVNGSEIELTVGANFLETVKNTANNAGYTKFRVFLNGSEIDPADAPAVVSDGDVIEIMPYDKPAC